MNRLSLRCAGRFDRAFPIGHLCAARGGEFLFCHERSEFHRELLRGNGQAPPLRIAGLARGTGPITGWLQGEVLDRQMLALSLPVDEGSAGDRIGRSIGTAEPIEHQFSLVIELQAEPVPSDQALVEIGRAEFMVHPARAGHVERF